MLRARFAHTNTHKLRNPPGRNGGGRTSGHPRIHRGARYAHHAQGRDGYGHPPATASSTLDERARYARDPRTIPWADHVSLMRDGHCAAAAFPVVKRHTWRHTRLPAVTQLRLHGPCGVDKPASTARSSHRRASSVRLSTSSPDATPAAMPAYLTQARHADRDYRFAALVSAAVDMDMPPGWLAHATAA
ncbi:hypothetical protein [Demequina lutea]|uniref:Uncharacterized protein n=1 Tax=Demequina lutea TaxID=431489 RepID=A0A7Y9ZDK6_9MICO|nr:hypothetical protein [Demequina lutea]NYI42920.1 hypothetical protein [Demequina lutea]